MEVYMDFIELEVQQYLQWKQSQGSQVSSEQPSSALQALQPAVLSPVNEAFTILQALQQPSKTPQTFAARRAAVACQMDVALGVLAPNEAVSTEEGSAFTVDPEHGLSHPAGPQL